MTTATQTRQTLDDLMRYDGKAELIGGQVVQLMPAGDVHGRVAFEVAAHLRDYARAGGIGRAYADNVGFRSAVPLVSDRESFCPDAAYLANPPTPASRTFVPHPPTFAVEVRSEDDSGPAAERDMAEKRADYFEAGTLAVWDVDPLAKTVALYLPPDPLTPAAVFLETDTAHADPAVPGWRVAVADLFV
jgi:Uma2 family endonuclease